jgi:hypothetical protein
MKVKLKTPQRVIVGFSRREMMMIHNCLQEACNGVIMDRFIPAHDELSAMLDSIRGIISADDYFALKPVAV